MERKYFDLEHCYICDGPQSIYHEKPKEWLLARRACQDHGLESRLPDGTKITDYEHRISPVEGSGLNYIVNPAIIEGQMGWASYVAGSFMTLEEIFESNSFFEFIIQHEPENVDLLYYFHKMDETLKNNLTRRDMFDWMIKTKFNYSEKYYRAYSNWQTQNNVNQQLDRSKLNDLVGDDFSKLLSFNTVDQFGTNETLEKEFWQELFKLARRRFSHFD